MSNPYSEVRALERSRRGGRAAWLLPVVASALATPLAEPVLLGFLEQGRVGSGVEGVAFRLGAVVAGLMALHTYTDLVRGPDRPVLDPHPVLPRFLLSAIAADTARQRFYLPVSAAILLSPIAAAGHVTAWAGASLVVLGAWLASLGVGFAVHLGGVWAGLSPSLARLMDLVRGDNPRMQAALIYAPGVALAVVGLATALAAAGLSAALGGWAPGWAFLLLPPALGAAGWLAAGPLAERYYVRATALLTEIDGMFAGAQGTEAAQDVYLEWAARGRPELLRVLRQGWRARRGWPLGAWALGLAGALAGWAKGPDAAVHVLAVSGGAVLALGMLPARLADGDPPWLDLALGVRPGPVAVARATTTVLYAQAALIPAAAALFIRHGAASLWAIGVAELLAVAGAGTCALLARRFRGGAAWLYGPLAFTLWAAVAGGLR